MKKKTNENTQLIVDLNAIKLEDKKQQIAKKKKEKEKEMILTQVKRLQKTHSLLKSELNALQTSKFNGTAGRAQGDQDDDGSVNNGRGRSAGRNGLQ